LKNVAFVIESTVNENQENKVAVRMVAQAKKYTIRLPESWSIVPLKDKPKRANSKILTVYLTEKLF